MATFQITAPDGRKFRITGDSPEGAHAALMKHLGAKGPSSEGQGADTKGFADPLLEAMRKPIPAPNAAAAGLATGTAPAFVNAPGRVSQPPAMSLPVAAEAVPKIDMARPESPAVRPRDDDRILFGMMGGASPDMDAWARREIARQTAETGQVLAPQSAPRTETATEPATAPANPFAGESAAALLKRRGQEFTQGASEMLASSVEGVGALSQRAMRKPASQAAAAKMLQDRALTIAGIEARLGDVNLAESERTFLSQNLADLKVGQEQLAQIAAGQAGYNPGFTAKAKTIRDAFTETFGTPPDDPSFWSKLSQGAGSMAGFLGTTLVGGMAGGPAGAIAATGGVGATSNAGQTYSDAKKAGASDEDALSVAGWGALIGSTEVIPIGRAFRFLPSGIRDWLAGRFFRRAGEIALNAGEEAAQEYGSQVANNLVATGYYDPDRGWSDGANESALIGAILGAGTGTGAIASATGSEESPTQGDRRQKDDKAGAPPRPVPKPPAAPMQPQAPSADPLLLTMGQRVDQPVPQVPPPQPPVDAQRETSASSQKEAAPKPPTVAQNVQIAQTDNFEILDEVETVDGETRPTGRKVRVDLTTGEASVVDATEAAGPPPASAPAARGTQSESQPQEPDAAKQVGAQTGTAAGGARPGPQRKFLSHDETVAIETDPQTFQYKGGADTEGVTTALQGVTRFDPNRAGQVVLFETKDGRTIVADGHQRAGLARRMAAAGQADVGGMAAVVYREADGYTPEEVMALAALKNIGEGSGTAVDAARILRTRSESIEDMGLPPQSALVRNAEGLRRLSDQAFGMVVNGKASEQHGAIVGRVVTNRDAQIGILGLLTKLNPSNAFQAESIARQAAEEVTTETQSSLFGDEEIAANLYLERAKVLDNAVKRLNDERRLFGTLTDRIEAITSAGNVLAKDENAKRLDAAGRMRDYLTSQANVKGPISEALSASARDLKAGRPVREATGRFLESLRREIEGDGGRGQEASGRGSVDQGESEGQRQEVAPPADDLLAAMGVTPAPAAKPAPKPEPSSEGDDLLAMMGAKPAKSPEPAARAQDEAKVRANQSKIRTGAPQKDAGPLFDTQGDIEKAAAKPTGADMIRRGREILEPYANRNDGPFDKLAGADLRDTTVGRHLAAALANAESQEKRIAVAEKWVRDQGKQHGIEHLVALDADGIPLAIMSGHKSGVSFHTSVWRAGADGKIAVSIHNHPSSGGFSAGDMAILSIWPKHRMIVVSANGERHEAVATERFQKQPDADSPYLTMGAIRDQIEVVWDELRGAINSATWEIARRDQQADGGLGAFTIAMRPVFGLALERAGVVRYKDSAAWRARFDAAGFNFEDIYGQVSGTLADRLGRAGFDVAESGDRGGDQAAGSGADTASSGTDVADRKPAEDGERGDRGGRVPPPDEVAPDDFDAALDAVFGATPAEPKVNPSGDRTYAAWASAVPSPGRENGWTIFDDTEIGGAFVLKTRDLDVRPFKSEADARAWAKKNAPASVRKAEAAPPEPAFDAEAFDSDRKKRIAASKADGNTHLDQVEPAVETLRGKAIYYVHDPKVRGVIRTVSNAKEVVVHWSDEYSAEKELAVEKTYGKKRVMESWLAPSDLKDYVLGTPSAEKKANPTLSPWRVERYENAKSPSEEWRVARNNGDNRKDVWGYYATKEEAESARAYAAKRAPASEKPPQRQASDIAKDLGDLFSEPDTGFREGEVDAAKYAQAVPLFREALAGVDMAAMPRKDVFVAMIRPLAAAGLKREAVAKMRPYFDRFLDDLDSGRITLGKEAPDAPGTSGDLERDRGDAGSSDDLGAAGIPAARRGDGTGAGTRGATPDGRGELGPGGERLSPDDAAPLGAERDQGIQGDGRTGQQPADDRDGARGRDDGEPRIPDDYSPAVVTRETARNSPDLKDRVAAQRAADERARRGIRLADEQNVRDTLPLLKPEQQDDVVKIERRFLKPDGHGMLLTNGTGTGKTYSGGGVVKRFAQAGKTEILILAPSQGILDHWIDALHDLGLSATKLESTTSAGKGIVMTTYANAGMNNALAGRKWDLIVSDEAHKLSQNAAGDATAALDTLRAISHRPADLWRKSQMLHADEWAKLKAMKDGEAKTAEAHRLFRQKDAEVAAFAKEPRAKVLFLSATPFAYDKNIDYADGYLFDYPADGHVGNSRQSGQNLFMVQNFGYRIRYHKLTKPDANVDGGVFEREFHEKLRRDGVLSGRHLDIEPDYERRFVQREDAQGSQIDGILAFIREEAYGKGPDKDAYSALLTSVNQRFNYLRRMQLLEAIKARAAQPDIDKHLALGRKVVIFHDYNIGGGFNPFAASDAAAAEGYAKLLAAKPEVADLNFTGYRPPVGELKAVYGDRAVIYNGTIPAKERAKAKADFNKDGSGIDIMIVQSAAGEAGISLHDVTGGHQRALINLGMPTRPTTALQEEGRIRREGSVSDALFHYYTIGTTWERQAFARKIAERSGTVENLALGNEARTIRDSFIESYEDASPWEPGEADGKGGKARDRAVAKASPYEIAKTHYFGRTKSQGRRDQREGIDFYPTPEPLGFKMVEWAGIRPYERVLEPSAGDGSIARYFPEHSDRTIVEPSAELMSRAQLRAVGAKGVQGRFEDYHIVNKHHVIVMNPPFGMGGKTAMEHLAKAAKHLRPGGRIVALIPTGPAADKRFDAWWDSDDSAGLVRSAEVALPAVTFEKAGTAIAAKVVILDKPHGEVDPVPARRINMTGASTIGEFFDRLEGISAPDRPAQQRDAADEIMDEAEQANPDLARPAPIAAPLHGSEQDFTTAETTHGKTGEKLWVATATKRVSEEDWKATVAVAKRHGGWFSSFRGRGAIPGYQFKSEADRQAFLDDMKKPTVGFEQPSSVFRRPVSIDSAIVGGDLATLSSHPDHEAAKAGDVAAAVRLAQEVVTEDLVNRVRRAIGSSAPIIVPVVSIEASGRNKIPAASAEVLAERLSLDTVADVVQMNSPKRTALPGLDRIFASPAFNGPVKAGQNYLMLDDTLTQGGTFAALASHIEAGGGKVVGAVALTGKQYSAILRPSSETLSALREKHGDLENDFIAATGYGFDALTESEARYLTNFKPAAAVRNRILAERGDRGPETDQGDDRPDLEGFEESEDQFQPQPAEVIRDLMPKLRAELDRLDLKRVRLFHDEKNMLDLPEGTQGMFLRNPHGGMAIVVAASLDPMKTLYHETIHALRSMNLFTPEEWRALEIKAARTWVKQFDIVARYPGLLPSEQIEEAIAEAFADAAATKKAPAGSLLVRAFNKIARFLKALANVLRGAGFQTVEDVFGRVLAGQLTRRDAGNTGALMAFQEDGKRQSGKAARTDTPEFRAWFGNSKVTNENGDPLVMLHSTWRDFEVFDPFAAEQWTQRKYHDGVDQVGIWFTSESPTTGSDGNLRGRYGPKAIEAYVKIERPLYIEDESVDDDPSGKPNFGKDDVYTRLKNLMQAEAKGSARAFRDKLRAEGYDGIVLTGWLDGYRGYVAIALDSNQVKSVFNRGTFDPKDARISYQAARVPSRQARAHMATAMGGQAAYIPDRRIWEELTRAGAPIWTRLREGLGAANDAIDKARIRLQDRFLPVLRAQEAVMRATGANLPADHNAYITETTFSGKVGRHLFEIDEDYTKPIIARIAATKGGLTADDVGEWLTARHAIERNAHIASINPKMPDGGSGMTNADAQAILAAAAAGPHAQTLQEIGDLIDRLRERTLTLREDAGLITHAEANLWRKQYKFYVPLKGFAETDHSEAVLDLTGVGRRFNVRGGESQRALGRRSEAFNPLQAAITQAQEVAIRAERNRVGQPLYNLAKDFPSPALWSVKKVATKRYYNRTTGLVETRAEDPVSLFMDPNEMAVKVGGEEYRVIFHDPRLARAAGSVGADQMGWFLSMMSVAARYFSSINTMLDPEFVIRNAFRDMTAAQINIRNFGEADRNYIAKAMLKNWPKAFVGAFRGMGNKADSKWTRLYREFEQSGAKVSFWKLEQPEAGKADLDKRIRLAGGSRLGPASRFIRLSTRDNPVLGFIERTNLAVDNAIRLAAYVAARDRNWDKADAAALAKNLTVNFNRRGEWGSTINALYPFANASIQGTQILFRAMTSKRMAKYGIGLVALGIIMDMVNAGLSEEDDDGELAYDKIADWKNRTNLMVMLGPESGEAATIWLPYGYSLFPYLGQQIGKVGRGVKEPGDAMADFASAMLGAFSPITGEDFQATLTPTMLDPINEMAMNEDWLGRPIRPENAYADYGPDAYKYYAGASEVSKQLADIMNRATGGTEAESGAIDVSPEYIDHMFGFLTGGAGRTVGRSADIVAKSVTGNFEEIELRDVPVARSLVYDTGDWLDRDRYYRFRDEVKEAHASAKIYGEAGKKVPKHIARIDALYSDMLAAEKALRAIKKQGGGDQARVMMAFNRRFVRVMGPQGE